MTKSNTEWNDGTNRLFEKALLTNPKTNFDNENWARLDFVLVPTSFDEIPKTDIEFPEEIIESYTQKREGMRFPLKKSDVPQGVLFTMQSSYGSNESLRFNASGVVSGHAIIEIITANGHIGGRKLSKYLKGIITNTQNVFWNPNEINPPFHLMFRVSGINTRFEKTTNSKSGSTQTSEPIIFGNLETEHDVNFLYDQLRSIFTDEFMDF